MIDTPKRIKPDYPLHRMQVKWFWRQWLWPKLYVVVDTFGKRRCFDFGPLTIKGELVPHVPLQATSEDGSDG